jgi:hypothetical protein
VAMVSSCCGTCPETAGRLWKKQSLRLRDISALQIAAALTKLAGNVQFANRKELVNRSAGFLDSVHNSSAFSQRSPNLARIKRWATVKIIAVDTPNISAPSAASNGPSSFHDGVMIKSP